VTSRARVLHWSFCASVARESGLRAVAITLSPRDNAAWARRRPRPEEQPVMNQTCGAFFVVEVMVLVGVRMGKESVCRKAAGVDFKGSKRSFSLHDKVPRQLQHAGQNMSQLEKKKRRGRAGNLI
jgi:hypothetical protein